MKNINNKIIGKKIKTLRKQAGFSQNLMASKLSVSYITYRRIEAGLSEIPFPVIIKICNIFNIPTLDYFLAEPGSLEEDIAFYGIGIENYNPVGISYLESLIMYNEDIDKVRHNALSELFISHTYPKFTEKLSKELMEYFRTLNITIPPKIKELEQKNPAQFKMFILDTVANIYSGFSYKKIADDAEEAEKYNKLNHIIDRAYLLFYAIAGEKDLRYINTYRQIKMAQKNNNTDKKHQD